MTVESLSFEKHEDDFAKISKETLLTVEVIQMWCDRQVKADPLFMLTGSIRALIINNKSDQQICRRLESKLKGVNLWEAKLMDKIMLERKMILV